MHELLLLGLRLEDALARLRERGEEEPEVLVSASPRGGHEGGTLRVVRVRPGQLTVCAFMDGQPV